MLMHLLINLKTNGMKKIMFNDKYGLTQAVLEGRKTQTRRIIKMPDYDEEYLDTAFDWDFRESVIIDRYAKYCVGEIVAIAQNYRDAGIDFIQCDIRPNHNHKWGHTCNMKGWNNKMFVQPEVMPHQIRITNVRVERLQDISDDDCLAEGIIKWNAGQKDIPFYAYPNAKNPDFDTPKEAYAELIGKVGKKGDWQSNPYVFVYDFKLIK